MTTLPYYPLTDTGLQDAAKMNRNLAALVSAVANAAPLIHGVTQYAIPMGGNAAKTTWADSLLFQDSATQLHYTGASLNILGSSAGSGTLQLSPVSAIGGGGGAFLSLTGSTSGSGIARLATGTAVGGTLYLATAGVDQLTINQAGAISVAGASLTHTGLAFDILANGDTGYSTRIGGGSAINTANGSYLSLKGGDVVDAVILATTNYAGAILDLQNGANDLKLTNAGLLTLSSNPMANSTADFEVFALKSVNTGKAQIGMNNQAGSLLNAILYGTGAASAACGQNLANLARITTNAPTALLIDTQGAHPIIAGINNLEVARFDATGIVLNTANHTLHINGSAANFDITVGGTIGAINLGAFGTSALQVPQWTSNGLVHTTGGIGSLATSLLVNADVAAAGTANIALEKLAAAGTIGNGGVVNINAYGAYIGANPCVSGIGVYLTGVDQIIAGSTHGLRLYRDDLNRYSLVGHNSDGAYWQNKVAGDDFRLYDSTTTIQLFVSTATAGLWTSSPASLNGRTRTLEINGAQSGVSGTASIVLRGGTNFSSSPAWEIALTNPVSTHAALTIFQGTNPLVNFFDAGGVSIGTATDPGAGNLQVNGLAGVGNRPVYADANGKLYC